LLGSFAPHAVGLVTAELQYDSRDDEIVTENGQFHTLRFRYSPPLGSFFPYAYERLTLTGRFYRSTIGNWLTFRARLVGDVLFGSPPFYELARFDETPAIGGSKAVRGVPAQRYYGGVKLFENVELSAALWHLTVRSKRLTVGPAVFVDAGRSWTEIGQANPELDGTGLGLKYGLGGGLRVQEGKTFILRLDVAWSPDATPIGAYFAAGEIF
jgi:outer membrane protein assembly factor BamA